MEIVISNAQEKMTVTAEMEQILIAVLEKTAEELRLEEDTEVSVVLIDDEYMQQLNQQYRGKDCSTDVLSFALNEGEVFDIVGGPDVNLLGDIFISMETAKRQAEDFGHSLERELAYLCVHGILHLLSYDHENEAEQCEMRGKEEQILSLLGITRA